MKKLFILAVFSVLIVSVSITSIFAQSQYDIPVWVKGVAGFWAEDKITDDEFGEGLAFLIDSDIIKVPKIQELQNEISQLEAEISKLRDQLNMPKPDTKICTKQYDPVCGVDGTTYGNQCVLESKGISLDYKGECTTTPTPDPTPTPNPASTVTITTADNDLAQPGCVETEVGCYTPNTATVNVGDIVTMTNTDEAGIHTFTSGTVDGFSPSPDGIFDSGMLMKPGDSFEYTTDTVGEFPYYCSLHVWMQGVIIVEG